MFKKITAILIIVILAISMVSCSGSKKAPQTQDNSSVNRTSEGYNDKSADMKSTAITSDKIQRKIIFKSRFEVQTKNFDKSVDELNKKISETKSYIEKSDSSGNKDDGNAMLVMTIRVPSDKLDAFTKFVPKIGNVTNSSMSGEDVSDTYYDTEARLKVLKAQEKRYMEFMNDAKTIEEMLRVEGELSRVRTEIEQLTATIKNYDNLVKYSTVEISLQQTRDYITSNKGFFEQIRKAFVDSTLFLWNLFKSFIILLAYLWYLIIIAIAILAVIIYRKRKNK